MSVLRLVLVCLLGLFVSVSAVDITSSKQFAEAVASGKNIFGKFYAPWCGHCKKLAPAWQALEDKYADSDAVVVASIDCTIQKDLCQAEGIRGYPTLKYWNPAEQAAKYAGGRSEEALDTFIQENLL